MRAQSSNAQLSGLVTDTTGAVISGAQIKATNTATNVSYSAISNGSGIYLLTELLPGTYSLNVSVPGFGTENRSGLVLNTGDHLTQNFSLKPGTVETTMTVTSGATLISSDESSSSDVLDNKMITELPQLNRNSLDLTATVPSIQGNGPQVDSIQTLGNSAYLIGNTGNSYSVSGGQVNGTSISVDGNQVQEAEFNATNRSIPTPDSIGEFRVESGVLTADKGRYAGGLISMETQSGTNTYHGRAFFYFRNQNLDSNDWTDNSLGNPRQDFHQYNYGVSAGGPVRIPHIYNGHDKTFFYGAWEGQRFHEGQEILTSVPTILNREGDFSQTVINVNNGQPLYATIYDPFNGTYDSNPNDCTGPLAGQSPCWVRPQFPGNKIPANYGSSAPCGTGLTCPISGQSQLFLDYLALWPQPNHAPAANNDHLDNRYDPINLTLPIDKYFLRMDEVIRADQHLQGSISRSMLTDNIPAPWLHGAESVTTDDDWSGSFLYTWTPTPKTIIDAHLGFATSKLISNGVSGLGSAPDPNVNTSKWPFDPLLESNTEKTTNEIPPALTISGYTPVGGSEFDSFITQTYNGTVSATRLIGRHSIKVGYEQSLIRFTEQGGDHTGAAWVNPGGGSNQYWNQVDGLTGSPLSELMMGSSNFFQWGNWDITPYGWNQAAYVMDDWKVNTKLTVQIGLRWDHDGARQGRHVQGSLMYDLNAKNVLSANSDWNWSQVVAAEPELASMPTPAWLTQGATGRVALLGTKEYPQKNLYTTNIANLQPRLGISWALNDKTVLHLSGGTVDQGLNGLSTDWLSFYYNSNTFNQVPTVDGQHWISEFGNDHGLGTFPAQPGGTHLGFVTPLTNNQEYWYASYGAAGNFDQAGTTIGHYDTPTDYMWGVSVQRQLGNDWAITAEYQGIKGVHLLTNVFNWSLNNTPVNFYQLGTHLNDQVPNPFYGQSQTFSSEPTVSLSQLLALSPQYAGTTSTTPGQVTWGRSFSNFANIQIQTRNYRGLALLASYAIRKTLSNTASTDIHVYGATAGLLQNPHNLMEGYGVALYEMPQTLKLNYNYDLPFGRGRQFMNHPDGVAGYLVDAVAGGWAVAGISTWDPKGTPVTVPTVDGGTTAPGAALRWSLANHSYRRSGASLSDALVVNGQFVNGNAAGVLNASAFTRTADYSLSNAPVMFPDMRNPGNFYTDASILKKYYFNDNQAQYIELRIEAQNIFNHPNFGNIIADPDSPVFGGINGKAGQRVMQAGVRYFF
ncbi:carboxypeptidase-like regulatory domain-containing protein [Acidicapsa dinghuensis]|uniref:Carboxypeptidase-like regulatory domain-containing protein n=1 Tax=Acidicapsa dinghuensis TaxID=2218256 RepID=A0ABW1EI77_9BACT|nr:carboxypeptidase-like regulatory domain-containing protein [Acidicapsa dinghuensis]